MGTRIIQAVSVLFAVLFILNCSPGPAIDLSLKLEKGKTYYNQVTTTQKIEQTVQGQTQVIDQTIILGQEFTVDAIDTTGNYSITLRFTRVGFKQTSPMMSMEYDSENPPEQLSPTIAPFSGLHGGTLQLLLTPKARILELNGGPELLRKMFAKIDLPAGPLRAGLENSIQGQFGDNALKEQLESNLAVYPLDPVHVGDIWKKNLNLREGMPLKVSTTYKLTSADDDSLVLAITSQVTSTSEEADSTQSNPMIPQYNLSGTHTGSLVLDRSSGWMLSGEAQQNLIGEVSMSGMIIPLSISGRLVFTSTR